MTIVEQLLKEAAAINQAHSAVAQRERHDFNVFAILRDIEDEVNLHSRFLFELLNPQGTHGMGNAFLTSFLHRIGITDFELATAWVAREYQSIDIFVADAHKAVIIENKISAPDQPRQLLRYYKATAKAGFTPITVVYLTLRGDDPSAESMGNLEPSVLVPMSYQDDIRDWLDACIEAADAVPVVRETLVQYQRLVETLTGQVLGRQIMDVKALLMDEQHMAAAITISQALEEAKMEIQFAFWLALEEKLIAEGYELTEYWKYSRQHVASYYRKGVRRYGLLFNLPELMGQELVAFFIGISHRVYYGFVPLEHGSPVGVAREPGFAVLAEILQEMDATWSKSPSMIGWRPTEKRLLFDTFSSPDVLALIDPDKRDTTVTALLTEIEHAIAAFYDACDADPRLSADPAW